MDRAANLLGALSLVVADRMTDQLEAASGQSLTTATALSALHDFLDDPSVDLLRRVLGLTHSGTVRLVDRLVAAGYVRRVPGPDGRTTAVRLTGSGRRAAAKVVAARSAVLDEAMSALSGRPAAERAAFERALGTVLVAMMRGPGATRWICRLCDTTACGRPEGRCPVAAEAGRRYG